MSKISLEEYLRLLADERRVDEEQKRRTEELQSRPEEVAKRMLAPEGSESATPIMTKRVMSLEPDDAE